MIHQTTCISWLNYSSKVGWPPEIYERSANCGYIDSNSNTPPHINGRQVSRGTVWTVGGLAPRGSSIDDGRGHFVRSGTHAQVFTMPLCKRRSCSQDELGRYHDRIASALSIDRARRILDFDRRATSPRSPRSRRPSWWSASETMTWNCTEWLNGKESKSQTQKHHQRRIGTNL
jgi:hypothetical protein